MTRDEALLMTRDEALLIEGEELFMKPGASIAHVGEFGSSARCSLDISTAELLCVHCRPHAKVCQRCLAGLRADARLGL